ncbi:MAG: hypothetical protein HY748_03135 [Elusimicrobia bacterium]|nr:hypothetical protein [Elusimicrobiota bacterium]
MTMRGLALAAWLVASSGAASAFERWSVVTDPLDAATRITQLIAADAPLPMTNSQKGKWQVSIRPVYFQVSQVLRNPDGLESFFRGQGLEGAGGSALFSYAFSDKWQVYGSFSGSQMYGDIVGKYGLCGPDPPRQRASDMPDIVKFDGTNRVLTFHAGLGYDLVEGKQWSIEALGGLFVQNYDSKMVMVPLGDETLYKQPYLDISGSGTLLGASAGAFVSRNLGKHFSVAPYALIGFNFSLPEIGYTIKSNAAGVTEPPVGYGERGPAGSRIFPTLGLNLTYRPWDLTAGIGGLLTSFYSEEIYAGLKLTKFSLSWAFGPGAD